MEHGGGALETSIAYLSGLVHHMVRLPRYPVLTLLRLYKMHLSPELRSRSCRFTPSCSVYAYEAIDRFGVIKGGCLAYRRLRRCAPEYPGGHDPVPETTPCVYWS